MSRMNVILQMWSHQRGDFEAILLFTQILYFNCSTPKLHQLFSSHIRCLFHVNSYLIYLLTMYYEFIQLIEPKCST